jgi:hypothetical protein
MITIIKAISMTDKKAIIAYNIFLFIFYLFFIFTYYILTSDKRKTGYNSTYNKLAVQWLNEALCFVSSSSVVDSFRLRNRQLLVAAKR